MARILLLDGDACLWNSVCDILELAPYLPVAFHDYSPHDGCHQKHSQICEDGTGRGGGTSAASPDLDGPCKICHL
jgi:hypothetical protein